MRLLSLIVIVAFFFTSCKNDFKEPVFNGIENVKMNKLDKGKSQLTLHLNCYNPNSKGAKMTGAEGQAWMDSTFLGNFLVDETVEIPANDTFLIPVKLDIEMKHIIRHSLSAFLSDSVLVSVKGKARVGRNGFFKKIPVEYKGKQKMQDLFKL